MRIKPCNTTERKLVVACPFMQLNPLRMGLSDQTQLTRLQEMSMPVL